MIKMDISQPAVATDVAIAGIRGNFGEVMDKYGVTREAVRNVLARHPDIINDPVAYARKIARDKARLEAEHTQVARDLADAEAAAAIKAKEAEIARACLRRFEDEKTAQRTRMEAVTLQSQIAREALDIARKESISDGASLDLLVFCVGHVFDIPLSVLTSRVRTFNACVARYCFFWIAREHYGMTLADIGKYFNRDHTTVVNGMQVAREKMLNDPLFKSRVDAVLRRRDDLLNRAAERAAKSAQVRAG